LSASTPCRWLSGSALICSGVSCSTCINSACSTTCQRTTQSWRRRPTHPLVLRQVGLSQRRRRRCGRRRRRRRAWCLAMHGSAVALRRTTVALRRAAAVLRCLLRRHRHGRLLLRRRCWCGSCAGLCADDPLKDGRVDDVHHQHGLRARAVSRCLTGSALAGTHLE
jgi:hypothetical protein